MSGNDTRVVPCSRSAHDRNVLARRAQLDHYGCHSQIVEASKLGGMTLGSARLGQERVSARSGLG
ncbi:MAG: hypothetical protein ACREI1_12670, partial [Nitrospiraceae bacterium]